jgi:hypothetical protein
MADYSIEVAIPNQGPQGPQGPAGEFGDLEAPEDGVIYGRKDAEWVDMTSPANLQVRRGTAAEVAAITPLEGEPVWDTSNGVLVVGDGSTAGGLDVGHKLLDGIGGSLVLQVVSAIHLFPQVQYQSVDDGLIGLTIPANSLVIGSTYRIGSGGLDDSGQIDGFAIGWSGDTDALFVNQTSSANASGVQMLAAPIWLSSSKAVSLEPPGASSSSLSGTIKVAVYFYSITAASTFAG